ncbi:MAG TPA: alpha/beta hydrolase [Vicinamibacterales bacterium]
MTRRCFLQSAAGTAAAASSHLLNAQTPLPVKTVRTNTLEIGYHEDGQPSGFPVILLHGFPDDAHAYDGVLPIVAKAGYRALAVYLRGYGPTRFLDARARPTAEQAAIGQDVIDFADALHLPRFAVGGFDWGGRAACVAAALHPERVRAAILVSGYTIQNTVQRGAPPSPETARLLWYQWFFNTDAGRDALDRNRRPLCRLLWREWSPTWRFSEDSFNLTAASFDNPDFVDCVIHSYRHRHLNAPGEPRFIDIERRLAMRPPVDVPAIVLYGADDAFGRPSAEIIAADRELLPQILDKRVVEGAGHFLPHEKPEAFTAAVVHALTATK